jgi:transketolase
VRGVFIDGLVKMADSDERIVLLTGDLGYTVIEPFADRFPKRFFNVGVAEQNMIGVATGLADGGFVPFVYSIATFASLRGYEFIRNGPVAHKLPVRVVGVGGGFEYGSAGFTHHALEDIAIMRVLPGMTVIAPADARQAGSALMATRDVPGPIYFRLGKDDQSVVRGFDGSFELGRIDRIGNGRDIAIVVTGAITREAQGAAALLDLRGIGSTVLIVATISPSPTTALAEALSGFELVATVEAHYVTGGLGSLVSEVVAEHGLACRLMRFGASGITSGTTGSERFLNSAHGLSDDQIAARIESFFKH